MREWERIVKAYSRAHLTYPKDKLTALSGMARFWAPAMKTRYIAGHWESHLKETLTWRVRTCLPRPAQERAPSFSWTAVEGEIEFEKFYTFTEIEFEIITVQTIPLHNGEDLFGPLSGGFLSVRGNLHCLSLQWLSNKHITQIAALNGTPISWTQDSAPQLGNCYLDAWPGDELVETNNKGCLYYFMATRNSFVSKLNAAIILACIDEGAGRFRREGVILDADKMLSECDPKEAFLPCESYNLERKQHIFVIE